MRLLGGHTRRSPGGCGCGCCSCGCGCGCCGCGGGGCGGGWCCWCCCGGCSRAGRCSCCGGGLLAIVIIEGTVNCVNCEAAPKPPVSAVVPTSAPEKLGWCGRRCVIAWAAGRTRGRLVLPVATGGVGLSPAEPAGSGHSDAMLAEKASRRRAGERTGSFLRGGCCPCTSAAQPAAAAGARERFVPRLALPALTESLSRPSAPLCTSRARVSMGRSRPRHPLMHGATRIVVTPLQEVTCYLGYTSPTKKVRELAFITVPIGTCNQRLLI